MTSTDHQATAVELTSTLRQSKDHVAAALDGEVVIMSIQEGEYFMLDPVASRVWELLDDPTTVAKVCDALCNEYEVDRAVCERDTLDLLAEMKSKELVTLGEN